MMWFYAVMGFLAFVAATRAKRAFDRIEAELKNPPIRFDDVRRLNVLMLPHEATTSLVVKRLKAARMESFAKGVFLVSWVGFLAEFVGRYWWA